MSASISQKSNGDSAYLIIGFPSELARRLLDKIRKARGRIFLLTPREFANADPRALTRTNGAPVEIMTGEAQDMHLGLSGQEYQRVCSSATDIFHLVTPSYLGLSPKAAWRAQVEGTRNVLELAQECENLRRLNHLSSCYVSGNRLGVIAEDELDRNQGFRNAFEEAAFQAEKLVDRARNLIPLSIYRPTSLVGDSKTGEIDRFQGPYYLALHWMLSPMMLPLLLPGDGGAPLNLVPADFVADAIWALSRNPRAKGRTFHLVDPNPMSTRRVCELMAEKANRRLPNFSLSAKAAEVMLRLPLLERLARPERTALNYLNHLAIYNCRNTLELLEGSGIRCPPLTTYLDTLSEYFQHHSQREGSPEQIEDPLEPPQPQPTGEP